jgi:hypothetical protein
MPNGNIFWAVFWVQLEKVKRNRRINRVVADALQVRLLIWSKFVTQVVSKPFTACNPKITTHHYVNIVLWPATSTEKDFTLIEKREKTKRKRKDKSTALRAAGARAAERPVTFLYRDERKAGKPCLMRSLPWTTSVLWSAGTISTTRASPIDSSWPINNSLQLHPRAQLF